MYICMCVYCIVCSAFVCGRFVYSWSRITVVQRRPQKPLNATSQHLNFKKFPGGTCPQTPLELGRVAASCLLLWSGPGITDILATPLLRSAVVDDIRRRIVGVMFPPSIFEDRCIALRRSMQSGRQRYRKYIICVHFYLQCNFCSRVCGHELL